LVTIDPDLGGEVLFEQIGLVLSQREGRKRERRRGSQKRYAVWHVLASCIDRY
jgi:hypothetical protein